MNPSNDSIVWISIKFVGSSKINTFDGRTNKLAIEILIASPPLKVLTGFKISVCLNPKFFRIDLTVFSG